jgi:hypothetical protein
MNALEFSSILAAGSLAAGFLGALTGLGGGVVIVPLLTLIFRVHIKYAIGASLVSAIATSSGAAAAYVKEGFSNAIYVPTAAIGVIFGLVLLYSAYLASRSRPADKGDGSPDPLATRLRMNGSFPAEHGPWAYNVYRVPAGFGLMFGAGTLSGLLGIGSGAVKVLAMDEAMKIPFKVSTTTSNFMIGVTAAASAGGVFPPRLYRPGAGDAGDVGVLAGSLLGSRVLVKARVRALRYVFSGVIVLLGIEMIYNGVAGRL